MRTAGVPNFRKLYGRINSDVAEGETLTFQITNNFEVFSYGASKSLVLSTLSSTAGSKSKMLSDMYIYVGIISLCLGYFFATKRFFFYQSKRNFFEL